MDADITIIGAGVTGLAIAEKLPGLSSDLFVVEKYTTFGQETSSRNSEVTAIKKIDGGYEVTLIGMESPGLTACLAIARIVSDLAKVSLIDTISNNYVNINKNG